MSKLFMFILALSLGLASAAAFGQQPTGSVEGTVKDPQGAVVQNATITIRNVATNSTRTATTGDNGHYRFSEVAPGTYEAKVTATNFKTSVVSNVIVGVGQNVPLDVHLEIGGASEVVTVTGGGEVQIDRTDNAVAGVVNTRQIQNLPLNGRNFLDLAQLQPGTEKVDGASFDPTKANYTGVSIAGQAGRSTQITVDGGSVVDNVVGTTTTNFGQEIAQEFQLGISNYDLSTGASATGSVNVISRSGTNGFHGNGYLYERDARFAAFPGLSRLDAANGLVPAAQATRIPFNRQQFGGTIGGPIRKDKLFFFFNAERNRQNAIVIHNIEPGILPGWSGFTPNPFRGTLITGKVDWIMSRKTTALVRYSHDGNTQTAPFPAGTGIRPQASASGIFQTDDQVDSNRSDGGVLGVTHIFNNRVTNDFHYNYNNFHNLIDPATKGFPEIRVYGNGFDQTWRSGSNYITPQITNQIRHQFKDDLTYTRGNHTFRFGGNEERTGINGLFVYSNPARIRLFSRGIINCTTSPAACAATPAVLATEADFLNDPVRNVAMGIGNATLPFNTKGKYTVNYRTSGYGTDTWKVRKDFTLNFGLAYRYDSNLYNTDLPKPAVIAPLFTKGTAPPKNDKRMISPRFGFAYNLGGKGQTIIRGGFGIYYDTTIDNLRLFERADLGPAGAELFLGSGALRSPLFPGNGDGSFSANPASASGFIRLGALLPMIPAIRKDIEAHAFTCTLPTSIECFGSISGPLFTSDFRIPYSIQYAAGIQRELPGKMLLQADYNYRRGVHEVLVYDANRDASFAGDRLPAFPNSVPVADSSGFSTYQALLVRLDKRYAKGFQFTASYTLSRLKNLGGDALGLGEGPTNLDNFRVDFGPGGVDRTHRLVVSGIWDLPYFKKSSNGFKKHVLGGYTLALISTAFSGLPESAFLPDGVDFSGTIGAFGGGATYLPGTHGGSIGRQIKSVSQLNALITSYNNTFPGKKTDAFGNDLRPLALIPAGTQVTGHSRYQILLLRREETSRSDW